MSDDQFDGPGSADQINWEDLEGRLMLLQPLELKERVKTKSYGEKDAIVVNLHVLDGPEAGTVYRNGYVFPLVLQGQIRGNLGTGRFNLGRLGKGVPNPGQKPPWKLSDPTDAEKDTARRYLASDKYKQNSAAPVAAASAPAPAPASDPWSNASDEPPF
ncbi:hypothetical protein [Mycobacteroides abscessus]|uniref:hypothetical protein n=1 Tax=Mycobacteroides abscessus TaxID=36809 RepID=UPI00092C7B17|nr:hypothetical protein [Mycobacteroides abscessus]DAZ90305.1 TPA_asm: hypothetical protein PROPHIFSQJ01-1_19 [Mycobacterium phage prophiFSQJ01-1]SII40404.1 Uncharacterised protein [Mycobacteroides abscessus subsp. abscessus]SIK14850.1 Uncharacterised protein [Mycobacteroides abscessus subsp. abscessus]SIN24973.1 Uncharacterised protein [Mycobacteroides abscessus subsp. abscessus]SLI51953.1 Uncharacterised protein [Mycobacteroides abscessus subsp. abscessus]